ncbi:MarR family transcriptional regulator [Candidatus Bipolaricaulota bacterium]|nr:MarR family transcriptional regulator [Candidatus Bipolaricaulota bacterium]
MSIERQGGFLISKIHRLSGRIFSRMLKEYDIEINPAQGRIVFVLWREDGIPIRELAERTSLGKSTLTSMLDRLEAAGYITRVRSEADRRVILVKRTAKDKAAQAAYERVSKAMSDIYYRDLTEAEIDQFERMLERILDNLIAEMGTGRFSRHQM